jgi:Tol biopolymer transport system component
MSDTLPVQLTVDAAPTLNGPQIDRSPRFSPDGTSILIVSNRGGRWGAWRLSPLGEALGLTVIAQDLPGAEIGHAAWSPDGARILISSDRSGERSLWILSNLGP